MSKRSLTRPTWNKIRIERVGESGRGTTAGRTGQHKGASCGRDGGRREAATDTVSGRRGQVPMGAQVSPQCRLKSRQDSASRRERVDAGSERRGRGMQAVAGQR